MNKNRVVITGMSMITPIGIGIDNYWNSVLKSKSGIDLVTRFDTTEYRCKVGGEVNDFDITQIIQDNDILNDRFDRSTGFALAAIDMAMRDANLSDADTYHEMGCYVGIALGGAESGEIGYKQYMTNKSGYQDPYLYHSNIPNGCMYYINKMFRFGGPCHTLSTGCTSSTDTIGQAYRAIKTGKVSTIIVGGTEAPITPLTYSAFGNIKALSFNTYEPQKSSRPFDQNRDGFVPSEGGCFLVLESLDKALNRNAKIYAEVLGFASSANAYNMVHPHPEGTQNIRAIELALDEANLLPFQIDYINAHGSSTRLNDSIETKIIKKVFNEHAYKLKISSTKSMVGHMLGAAGAIEIATTCLGIFNSVIPPTINYENPDPECDLNYTPNHPVSKDIEYAMSNATGFGGLNSVIILRKYS
ncbi:MAG: beta-ketoacyl-[acyl-carrier-protein] synthase family protein [Dysgonomonas sp.]